MPKDQSDEELRARVFISCGQNKSSEEPLLAAGIKDKLTALGFDPYDSGQFSNCTEVVYPGAA